MAGQRFEDLPVWQSAINLAVAVFELTALGRFPRKGDLVNQLERAALSVSNNIAEGWERGTQEELLTFLYYAKGSCGEVRSMLRLLTRLETPDLNGEINGLIEVAIGTSRQLGSWMESIKNSRTRGPRYNNATTRNAEEMARRQADFLETLRRIKDEARREGETSEDSS